MLALVAELFRGGGRYSQALRSIIDLNYDLTDPNSELRKLYGDYSAMNKEDKSSLYEITHNLIKKLGSDIGSNVIESYFGVLKTERDNSDRQGTFKKYSEMDKDTFNPSQQKELFSEE